MGRIADGINYTDVQGREDAVTAIINGCKVTIYFSDKPVPKTEDTVVDILMSAFEERIHNKSK